MSESESRYLQSIDFNHKIPPFGIAEIKPARSDFDPPDSKNCFLRADFNNDGAEDFAGLFQNARHDGPGDDWIVDLLVLYSDDSKLNHVLFPSSGTGNLENETLHQFLVLQAPGPVDLKPGRVVLEHPGILSFRFGQPALIYFWRDDRFTRRKFYVDD